MLVARELGGWVFDADGCLNDAEGLRNSLWPVAAEKFGYPGFTKEQFRVTLGRTPDDVIEEVRKLLCPDEPLETGRAIAAKVRTYRNELVNQHLNEHGMERKPGAVEVLAYLDELKIPTILWTSSKRSDAVRLLELTELRGYFPDDRIVTAEMVKRGKPDAEGAFLAAAKIGIEPAKCAGVDDSSAGTRALRAAGMYSIRVPDLEGIRDAQFEGVDREFPNLLSMWEWMRRLRFDSQARALII